MLIDIKNLNKSYVSSDGILGSKKNFKVLNDISFNMPENFVLGIIGESGSGKTTLAKVISKLTDFDSGSICVENKNINSINKKEFSGLVQIIFQNNYASFNPKLTIGYSLSEALDKTGKNKTETIKDKLRLTGLDDISLNHYPYQFSGGQRQRIAIARALLKNPKILIADEPFASLDIKSQSVIMDIFQNIKKHNNTNIIFISHDICSAMEISDRILILKEGRVIKYGTVDEIKNSRDNEYINSLISATYLE